MRARLPKAGGTADFQERDRLEQRIEELTREKDKLEMELRRLVAIPFYQTNKNSQLESQ
jgi:hypothetical protein